MLYWSGNKLINQLTSVWNWLNNNQMNRNFIHKTQQKRSNPMRRRPLSMAIELLTLVTRNSFTTFLTFPPTINYKWLRCGSVSVAFIMLLFLVLLPKLTINNEKLWWIRFMLMFAFCSFQRLWLINTQR